MLHVLIADDSKAMRLQVTRALHDRVPDAIIHYAANGAEVLKTWLSDSPPDLMVLDVHMPVLSGLEVLRQIAAHGGKPPRVIIYTASRDDVVRRQCLEAGATAVITKSHDDIGEVIAKCLADPAGTR